MTLIIEDGSIVDNANSYVSTADLSSYAAARGITISGTLEQLLIKAMDYIEGLNFKGTKRTRDQSLQWPRVDVWIDGYYIDADSIPTELLNSQMEAALSIDSGNGPLINLPKNVKRQKVGDLELEYMDGSYNLPINRALNNSVKKLLNSEGMILVEKA